MDKFISKLRLQFKDDEMFSAVLDKLDKYGSKFDADDIHYLLLMIEKLTDKN